jgi:hypothetical protein
MSSKNFYGLTGDVTVDGGILNVGNANLYVNTETSNVGIGTTNPGFELDVRGDANVHNLYATYLHGDGSNIENIVSSQWEGSPGDPIYYTSNVGVANTAPVTKTLQVGSNLYVEDAGSNVFHVTGNIYADYFVGDGSQLTNIASTLQTITDSGNTTSNTLLLTNADTGLVATGNVEANYLVTNNIYMPESVITISSESVLTGASVEWAAKIAGNGGSGGRDISVDSSGNVYVIGGYSPTLNVYSQGSTTPATQLSSSGNGDVFIAKYDTNGVVLWAAKMGGSGIDDGYGISVDGTGNVYVTGLYSNDTLTFYTTSGTSSGKTLSNSGAKDVFIAKYDTNGVVQWAASIAGSNDEEGRDISVDSSGNVYVIGHSDSTTLNVYSQNTTTPATQLSNSGI